MCRECDAKMIALHASDAPFLAWKNMNERLMAALSQYPA
jgi:hypothetical protein